MPKFASIAVPLPLDRTFHYSIPARLEPAAAVGKRAFVPFHNRSMVGYIVGLSDTADVSQVKELSYIIDQEPIIDDEMLKLTRWMADTYFCSWGEALHSIIPQGIKKGCEEIGKRIVVPHLDPARFQSSVHLKLNAEQEAAFLKIEKSIRGRSYATYLLSGITGSGKTEVYLQAISEVLKNGRQAIALVPEISLTPQAIERFVSRFGEKVALIHSGLTAAKRFLEWKKIRDGKADIVIGARSAIFSPTNRLGLIVIDEEHETTYKQDDVPRYHARDVAIERARYHKCPLILGSATPSLESYYNAKQGVYELLTLTKRIDERPLPKVKLVDMRMDLAVKHYSVVFSKVLLDAIEKTVKSGKQAILFINRRGFATFVNCKKCGFVVKCKRCDISMVYHFEEKKLICHYCDHNIPAPDICPNCRSGYISYFGLGTEKVESELAKNFPGVKIGRMDSDTTQKRGSHDRILGDFKSGKIDILVGTQMITKGLDIPAVTLVGVVAADVTLNIPDFRASERTFNLLTQVGGRAGRGDDIGEVIVQTYAPEHYSILCAAKHDFEKFYEEEIIARKELLYPPFTHLVKITVRARKEEDASSAAIKLRQEIETADRNQMICGPALAPIARLRGYFRYNILLKGKDPKTITKLLKQVFETYKRPHGVLVAVDVDPVSM